MKRKKSFFPILTVSLVVSLGLFVLSKQGLLRSVPLLQLVFAPAQKVLLSGGQMILHRDSAQRQAPCVETSASWRTSLQADNTALRDQFQTTAIPAKNLLPARIVGEPGFIPGSTSVEKFTLDKGSRDGVTEGMVVVYKDNVLGEVHAVTKGFAEVVVVSNKMISFSAKTVDTKALGVVKGQGSGDIILDNVVLDNTLKANDLVVTNGDMDVHGQGMPPDLVVGKITGIEKDPSALFQKADITSLVDITKLNMVFVKITN